MFKILKNKKINIFWGMLFSISLFCFLQIPSAQAGLVPCGLTSDVKDKCTLCHLFEGIDRIIDWGLKILVVVALVAIVAGAIMYIISAGNNTMMESAKNVIKQALWGVVIVLGAWVIVNTTMWLLATKLGNVGITSWSEFDCEGGTTVVPPASVSPNPDGTCPRGYHLSTARTVCLLDGTVITPNNCTSFNVSWAPTPCTAGSTQTGTSVGVPAGCTGTPPAPTTRACPDATATVLPDQCKPYEAAFESASGGDRNKKCLLVGIAMGESTCNPTATNGDGCGIMQIEGGDCDYLIDHPAESITQAAQILDNYSATLEKYKTTFDIGNNIEGNGETIVYGTNTYDRGNDDLIASYNGGTGNRIDNGEGKKDPFAVSTDCPTPPTPAWQCHINPGDSVTGFGVTTQPYVQRVQNEQYKCLGN